MGRLYRLAWVGSSGRWEQAPHCLQVWEVVRRHPCFLGQRLHTHCHLTAHMRLPRKQNICPCSWTVSFLGNLGEALLFPLEFILNSLKTEPASLH